MDSSPYLLQVLPATCVPGTLRAADASGDCVCVAGAVEPPGGGGGPCISLAVLLPAVLVPLAAVALAAVVFAAVAATMLSRLRSADAVWDSKDERVMMREIRNLRAALGICRRDGFILSSERAPIWRRQESYTVIQAAHMEAAARFSQLRDDFDIKHLDAFCACLQNSGKEDKLRKWMLHICSSLLDPNDSTLDKSEGATGGRYSAERIKLPESLTSRFTRVADESLALHRDTAQQIWNQEKRFDYFKARVWPLRALFEENQKIFSSLQQLAGGFLDEVGRQCNVRYLELMREPRGQDLFSCHATCGSAIGSEPEWTRSSLTGDDSGPVPGSDSTILTCVLRTSPFAAFGSVS